jgi:hypothetical protein
MSAGNQLTSEIQYDDRLDSYASFFDHAWAKAFYDASEATRLHKAAHDLCRDWKGIALASRMSWLMVISLEGFHAGFTQTNPAFSQRFMDAVGNWVADNGKLRNMARRAILAEVKKIGAQVQEEMRVAGPPIDREKIWKEYLQVGEIPWALWASQRLAYGSLYYAYENFLQRAVGLGRGDDEYRAYKPADLKRDFDILFGSVLTRECLDDPQIEIARCVRNALTHDGGRESGKLRALQHRIRVSKGQLQIFPEDVQSLFGFLKEKALNVANAAKLVAAFKLKP